MISLTIFNSIFDNKTHRRMDFKSWDSFRSLLHQLSEMPGYKPKLNEYRNGSPLITPAIFNENATRANKNVIAWGGWAALDVDEYSGSYETVIDSFRKYTFTCYSSASSRKEKPKFRMVFPLTKSVEAKNIKHFWFALNSEFNSVGDRQTKDLSRMYYVPANYPDSFRFIFDNDAASIDPDEFMIKHKFEQPTLGRPNLASKLPEAIQQKILEYRKTKLDRKYTWSSWRDCPFINREIVNQYFALTSNWYSGMYRIMVSIASLAIKKGYDITSDEIESLCREIDAETGNWYAKRPMKIEASRAIDYALSQI